MHRLVCLGLSHRTAPVELRERLVLQASAPGMPFDHARFDLVVEPFDAPDPRPARRIDLVKLRRKPAA